MSRWTKPTTAAEKRYYSKYADAIRRYDVGSWVVQGGLGALAFVPVSAGLGFALPAPLHKYIPVLSGLVILLLHFVLHSEVLELFGSIVDGYDQQKKQSKSKPQGDTSDEDENGAKPNSVWYSTIIENWHQWVLSVLIVVVFVYADIYGGSYTFESLIYEPSKINADSIIRTANQKAERQFTFDTMQIGRVVEAMTAQAVSRRNLTYAQSKTITNYKERLLAQSSADNIYRNDIWVAERVRDSSLTVKTSIRDKIISDASSQVSDNKNENVAKKQIAARDANSKSWVVTVIGWILFLLMSVRLAILRTRSGIRKHNVFTDWDAQGSTVQKLWLALSSAFSIQAHRFITFMYGWLSWGRDSVQQLDTNVIMQNASPTPQDSADTDTNTSVNTDTNTNTGNTLIIDRGEAAVSAVSTVYTVNTRQDNLPALANTDENIANTVYTTENTVDKKDIELNIETEFGTRDLSAFCILIRNTVNRASGDPNDVRVLKRRDELLYYLEGAPAPKMLHWCVANTNIVGDRCAQKAKFTLDFMKRRGMENAFDVSEVE